MQLKIIKKKVIVLVNRIKQKRSDYGTWKGNRGIPF